MQEQERVANEEAEKRLKAALTAKREPSVAIPGTASPTIGTTAGPLPESKPLAPETSISDDVSMEAEPANSIPAPEARDHRALLQLTH